MTAPVPTAAPVEPPSPAGCCWPPPSAPSSCTPSSDPDGSVVRPRCSPATSGCGPWGRRARWSRSSGSGAPPGCPPSAAPGPRDLAGTGLLLAFGVVVVASGLATGTPLEASFLAFAIGLLLLAVGSVLLGARPAPCGAVGGWWTALPVAAAGALVALLVEQWHDLGLLRPLRRLGAARRGMDAAQPPARGPRRGARRLTPAGERPGRSGTAAPGSREPDRDRRRPTRTGDGDVELRALRTDARRRSGSTVVVLDDRLVEALRLRWTAPPHPGRDRPGSPSSRRRRSTR